MKVIDLALLDKVSSFATFHGRMSRSEVVNFYKTADYALLLRDENKLFVKAGCPTKIVESLFYGVPPITNLFGDLSEYLIDSKNSIIASEHSIEEFKTAIIKSIKLIDSHKELSDGAIKTAHSYFESSKYLNQMKEFIRNEQ